MTSVSSPQELLLVTFHCISCPMCSLAEILKSQSFSVEQKPPQVVTAVLLVNFMNTLKHAAHGHCAFICALPVPLRCTAAVRGSLTQQLLTCSQNDTACVHLFTIACIQKQPCIPTCHMSMFCVVRLSLSAHDGTS